METIESGSDNVVAIGIQQDEEEVMLIEEKAVPMPFESVKDIGKIRWTDFGDPRYPGDGQLNKLNFYFNLPVASRFYKGAEIYYTNAGPKDYSTSYQNERLTSNFISFCEFEPGFYCPSNWGNREGIKERITTKETNKGKILSPPIDLNVLIRADGGSVAFDNITGEYYRKNATSSIEQSDFFAIKEITASNMCGIVYITDKNYGFTTNKGYHYVSYDEKQNHFVSDSTFGKLQRNNKQIGSDKFIITVKYFDDERKLLLLDTESYVRPYIPVEYFFTENTDKVYIENDKYTDEPLDIHIYGSNSFDANILHTFKSNKRQSAKVIDKIDRFEEHNDELSIWVKVRIFDSDIEGWVWGTNININEYTSFGLDDKVVAQYLEYIKYKH